MLKIRLPEEVYLRTTFKKKFSYGEMYRAFLLIPAALFVIIDNRWKKLVDRAFVERIQLAVTEVNGCAACSYAHAYMALKQNISEEEINSLLSGDGKIINPEEAKAIFFGQHYADTRGFPKKDAYLSIVAEYGEQKARIILAAAQLMTVGNIYGIPYSAFVSRLKGKPYKGSSISYELGMQIVGFLIMPFALIHGFFRIKSKVLLDEAR